jgi:hypothetical protein
LYRYSNIQLDCLVRLEGVLWKIKLPAKTASEQIETRGGKDDVAIEDFIKNVRYARSQCYQKPLPLKLFLVEKITERKERITRFVEIKYYEHLYAAPRQNVSIPNTVTSFRDKLKTSRQANAGRIRSHHMRFRQQLKELIDAIRNKHSKPVSRRIAIEEEKTDAIEHTS